MHNWHKSDPDSLICEIIDWLLTKSLEILASWEDAQNL